MAMRLISDELTELKGLGGGEVCALLSVILVFIVLVLLITFASAFTFAICASSIVDFY